jgi:hypothetical protein
VGFACGASAVGCDVAWGGGMETLGLGRWVSLKRITCDQMFSSQNVLVFHDDVVYFYWVCKEHSPPHSTLSQAEIFGAMA